MQHCDTFLGTVSITPYREAEASQRLAWWISLLSLLTDDWVTQAVAPPNKPTPAFLMTQGTCIVAVLCTACKQWHHKELCLCPSNLVLLILSSHKDRQSALNFFWVSWASSVLVSPRRDISVWGNGYIACRINTSPWLFSESKFLRNSEVD